MGRVLIVLVALCVSASVFAQQQPTAAEMAFIYELNRARSDPQRYDTENSLGGILNGVAAQPPLALNLNLVESARFHSTEMANNGYFGHQSSVTGDWPNKMARDAGYPLNSGLSNTTNNIESLAARYSNSSISYSATEALKALIIDAGVPSLGHRKHLLAMEAFYQNFTEVGTGYDEGQGANGWTFGAYWSIHTGYRDTAMTWLTGVVYDDANSNGRYDQGEGLSGVTVSVAGGGSMVTTTGGGWSISVSSGSHSVTCSGGAFSGTATANVTVASDNIEVDFTSGDPDGDVGFSGSSTGGSGGSSGGGGDSDSGGGGCVADSGSGAPWWALGLMVSLCVLVAGWRLALPLDSK